MNLIEAQAQVAIDSKTVQPVGHAALHGIRFLETFIDFFAKLVGFFHREDSFLDQFIDERIR